MEARNARTCLPQPWCEQCVTFESGTHAERASIGPEAVLFFRGVASASAEELLVKSTPRTSSKFRVKPAQCRQELHCYYALAAILLA